MDGVKDIDYPHEAEAAIRDILAYGKSKGYPVGGWRLEPAMHHLGKAIGHLGKFLCCKFAGWLNKEDEDHIACALCRLAMCLAVLRQNTKEVLRALDH